MVPDMECLTMEWLRGVFQSLENNVDWAENRMPPSLIKFHGLSSIMFRFKDPLSGNLDQVGDVSYS